MQHPLCCQQGAYFLSFGAIDWQWSSLNRGKVAERIGPASTSELALIYECLSRAASSAAAAGGGADPLPCAHARFSFAANGSVAFESRGEGAPAATIGYLGSLAWHPWVRVEATGADNFLYEGEARWRSILASFPSLLPSHHVASGSGEPLSPQSQTLHVASPALPPRPQMDTTCRAAGIVPPAELGPAAGSCRRNACEYWANTRPKHGVWSARAPPL